MSNKKWQLISFVISSRYRQQVLNNVSEFSTPTQLSKKLKINRAHISRALIDLAKNGLVECKTPEERKGRIYLITKLGKEIQAILKNN